MNVCDNNLIIVQTFVFLNLMAALEEEFITVIGVLPLGNMNVCTNPHDDQKAAAEIFLSQSGELWLKMSNTDQHVDVLSHCTH